MRFERFAIKALAILAVSHYASTAGNRGFALAQDDAADATSKIQVEEDSFTLPEAAESFAFEAEVSRMLDIVVNSLYQNKDVFLRELISNASDALDKIRFLGLTKPELLKDEAELKVEIEFDDSTNQLIVRDTGIGMTHDEMIQNLGTVARSGTTKFLQALQDQDTQSGEISQIGQFGVGFYSAFLVADRIQVASKSPSADQQYVWTSTNGASEFQIFEDPRGNTLKRGTEITLTLKEDCLEYANEMRLRDLAQFYSEFVMHPIMLRTVDTMEVEVEPEDSVTEATDSDADADADADANADSEETKEDDDLKVEDSTDDEEKPKETKTVTTFEWEHVNGNPAIWTRSKEDITDEEYQAFWKTIAKDELHDSATWSHFNAEGNINFKSILYLPSDLPQSVRMGNMMDSVNGMRLYVRKVLISDEFELLPRYLSFIRGVVDSDDLPLNVNRETLQESKIIQVIKKKLVRKAIDMIRQYIKDSDEKLAAEQEKAAAAAEDEDADADSIPKPKTDSDYIEWYKIFAPSLKMGVIDDEPNRGKLMKLLRFQTSKSDGKWISLQEYIDNMKDWQDEIYTVAGINVEAVEKSQFLEPFKEKDVEVIYMTDPIDEYVVSHVRDFDSKKFVDVSSENVKFKDEDADLVTRREKFYKNKFKPLTKWMKKLYGASIMRVAISKRLGSIPAIASSASHSHSANMERIMRAQAFNHGQHEFQMKAMRILEINPRHPLILKLLEGCPPEDAEDDSFPVTDETIDAAWMVHDMALLNGGFPLSDSDAHSKRMLKALQSTMGIESLALEAEIDPPEEEDEPPEMDASSGGLNMEDLDLDLDDMGIKMEDLEDLKAMNEEL
mmetsp:Transcript_27027/g.76035  ORF Transcript_27027/g.76035 Transcript_27027/m.76035 type:complete len:844 (+) Transcript_27027:92-2623(+)